MKTTFLLSLLLVVSITGCSKPPLHPPATPETVQGFTVVNAASSRIPDLIVAVGTVRSVQTAHVAAQMTGSVVSVNVHEGDLVRQGQVLATLDPAQPQAGLERARATLAAMQHELGAAEAEKRLAESTLQRFETLYQRRSVSPQEYDEVKARHVGALARAEAAQAGANQAQAAVAQAQSAFGYTRLRAPFAGIITERKADPGSLAMPGIPLLTVEDTTRYRLEAAVDENHLRFVKLGSPVPIAIDAYPEEVLEGRVSQIIPAADANTRTFLVKIDLPQKEILRTGLFGRASFARGERESLMVPATAVVERGSLKAVYVVGLDQIAALRYVTLGTQQGDRVEVLSGLSPNESIVAAPLDREIGGKKIGVQP